MGALINFVVYNLNQVAMLSFLINFYLKAQSNPWNPEKTPFHRVISNHFMTTTVTKECTVQDIRTKYDLRVNAPNVYIECTNPITEDFRDIMLLDKVNIIMWLCY